MPYQLSRNQCPCSVPFIYFWLVSERTRQKSLFAKFMDKVRPSWRRKSSKIFLKTSSPSILWTKNLRYVANKVWQKRLTYSSDDTTKMCFLRSIEPLFYCKYFRIGIKLGKLANLAIAIYHFNGKNKLHKLKGKYKNALKRNLGRC